MANSFTEVNGFAKLKEINFSNNNFTEPTSFDSLMFGILNCAAKDSLEILNFSNTNIKDEHINILK